MAEKGTSAKGPLLILACMLSSCVGCCSRPGLEQVRAWVKSDIPPGSSEEDVRRFCQAHRLEYAPGNPGEAWANAPGCLLADDINVYIKYDDARRVERAAVELFNTLP